MAGSTGELPLDLEEIHQRLVRWGSRHRRSEKLWNASDLAAVIWPHNTFSYVGAGAAASRVLKAVGAELVTRGGRKGWSIAALVNCKTVTSSASHINFHRRPDPTPEQIRQRCSEVRKGWDATRRRHAETQPAVPFHVPQVRIDTREAVRFDDE